MQSPGLVIERSQQPPKGCVDIFKACVSWLILHGLSETLELPEDIGDEILAPIMQQAPLGFTCEG